MDNQQIPSPEPSPFSRPQPDLPQKPSFVPSPAPPPKKVGFSTAVVLVGVIVALGIGLIGGSLWQRGEVSSLNQSKTDLQLQLDQQKKVTAAIDTSKFQSIFFKNEKDQTTTYFGKLSLLDSQDYKLTDIYYFKDNTNQSLVKLGCEIHGPNDQMVINRGQVVFWENLKDDGQVVKAIADYKKANPTGQKCEPVH